MAKIVKLVAGVDEEAEVAAAKPKSWAEHLERTYASVGKPGGWAALPRSLGAPRASCLLWRGGKGGPGSNNRGQANMLLEPQVGVNLACPSSSYQAPPLARDVAAAAETAAPPLAVRWSA